MQTPKPQTEVLGRDVAAWTPEIELAASQLVEALISAGARHTDDSEVGAALVEIMHELCCYRRMKKLAKPKDDHFDGHLTMPERKRWLYEEPYVPRLETKRY